MEKKHFVIQNHETIDAYLEQDLEVAFPGVEFEVINAAAVGNWSHQAVLLFLVNSYDGWAQNAFSKAWTARGVHDQRPRPPGAA